MNTNYRTVHSKNLTKSQWQTISSPTHNLQPDISRKGITPVAVAVALALTPVTQYVYAGCSTTGDTRTCVAPVTTNDSINESGGNPVTVHNLTVTDVDISNFTAGTTYSTLLYKTGIGLAGNNADLPHAQLGSLNLTVNGGSIVGSAAGQLSGLYTRSDAINANVLVNTSTRIDITSTGATGPVYGILNEHFAGANGSAQTTLNNGSNITVTATGGADGAGVRVVDTGVNGLAKLAANGTVSVTSHGTNIHGYSVSASGTNGNAVVDLSNTTSSIVSVDGLNAVGIMAGSTSGDATIKAKGNIDSQNTGTATGTTQNAHGIYAYTNGGAGTKASATYDSGTITIKGSGTDTGNRTIGGIIARAQSGGDAEITFNTGSVVMDGSSYAVGLGVYTTGNALVDFLGGSIQNTQNASNTATDSDGIHVNATGNIAVNAHGSISTAGTSISEAIIATSTTGDTTVNAYGNITTTGTGSGNQGIYAVVNTTGKTAKVTYNNATGGISTTGSSSHAIQAYGVTGNAVINVQAAQEIKTTGSTAYALFGNATGSGTVDITNNGTLKTTGTNSSAIRGTSVNGNIHITNDGDITTTNTTGTGTYSGNNAIYARATGTGNIFIDSSGNLETQGADHSSGITAFANSGNIRIDASGNIKTNLNTGAGDSDAIAALSNTGSVTIVYDDANGTLDMLGEMNDGIQVTQSSTSTGAIDVTIAAARAVNVGGNNAQGIYIGTGLGAVTVRNHAQVMNIGNSTTSANNGIMVQRTGTGTIDIASTGDIIVNSNSGSPAILATSVAGQIDIYNSGAIQTTGGIGISGAGNHGIQSSTASGATNIILTDTGSIKTVGNNSHGIYAANTAGGGIDVISRGSVETADGRGIVGWAASGDVTLDVMNNVTTAQATATTHNHGIEAGVSANGKASVYFDNGTVKVSGNALGGGNNIGVVAWDRGTLATSVDGHIALGSNAIVDATQGVGGIQMRISGNAQLDIAQGAQVHGGSSYGVQLSGTGATAIYTVNNAGLIDSMNDRAVLGNIVGGTALIDNYGTITGFASFATGTNVTFNN